MYTDCAHCPTHCITTGQLSDFAALASFTNPGLAPGPPNLQAASVQNHGCGFSSKGREGFVVLLEKERGEDMQWRTRGFCSALSAQDYAIKCTNHVWQEAVVKTATRKRGSKCFFQLQPQEQACWKRLSVVQAGKQLKLWRDSVYLFHIQKTWDPVIAWEQLKQTHLTQMFRSFVQLRHKQDWEALEVSLWKQNLICSQTAGISDCLKKCSGFYFWYLSHWASDADSSESKEQWITYLS